MLGLIPTSVGGRKQVIAMALGAKALWRDIGFSFELLAKVLHPEEWEVKYYDPKSEEDM